MRCIKRIDVLHGSKKTLQGRILCRRSDAIVEIFQEVRLTGTVVTVDPDADMVIRLVVLYSIKDTEESVQNLVCKDVFLDLYSLCLFIEFGCGYCRVYSAFNRFAVKVFKFHGYVVAIR